MTPLSLLLEEDLALTSGSKSGAPSTFTDLTGPPVPSVLIVDDDPGIREMLDFALTLEGFEVHSVPDGVAALDYLGSHPADVVLLDVMMPKLDGYDVLKHLRADERSASIPVIFLTAKANDTDVWEGWQRGGDSYITKPLNMDVLLGEMGRVGAVR